MLYYGRIDLSEGIGVAKVKDSKESLICDY